VGDRGGVDEPLDPVHPGRGRQFYGGDLDGAAERLDHLVDLGVTALYHTPVFPAESNHRYDASRFDAVDPLLGGDDAYLRLVEAAHARGIRVIGDLTTNHPAAPTTGSVPRSVTRVPPKVSSTTSPTTNTVYETWLDAPTLPKFDWNSPDCGDGSSKVPTRSSRAARPPYAIDGWRIDVANMTGRLGAEDLNAEVRRTLRRTMIEVEPDTLLLAESTNDAASDLQGDAWHGGMTYPAFTRGVWSWLADPRRIPHRGFDGSVSDDMWFFGLPTGMPRYTAAQFVRSPSASRARSRGGCSAARCPRSTPTTPRASRPTPPGAIAVAVGLSMTLPASPSSTPATSSDSRASTAR
jgi:alpha-glucosidase